MTCTKSKTLAYSLLELIISLFIATIVVNILLISYSCFSQSYHKLITSIKLNSQLQKSITIIAHDLKNAGKFGSYDLHRASFNYIQPNTNYNYCSLNNTKIDQGIQYDPGSIIITQGINVNQYLQPSQLIPNITECDNTINESYFCKEQEIIKFKNSYFFNNNLNLNAATLIFASSNRLYLCNTQNIQPHLINFESTEFIKFNLLNCNQGIAIESYNDLTATSNIKTLQPTVPNISTLSTMNFNQKQYYLSTINGIHGLYYRELTDDCRGYTNPILLSSVISKIELSYTILYPKNTTNNIDFNKGINNQMIGNMDAANNIPDDKLGQIVGVTLTLTAGSSQISKYIKL